MALVGPSCLRIGDWVESVLFFGYPMLLSTVIIVLEVVGVIGGISLIRCKALVGVEKVWMGGMRLDP